MIIIVDMTAYKEEIFGPVLCVINVDTLDEAIEVTIMIDQFDYFWMQLYITIASLKKIVLISGKILLYLWT